MRVLMVAEKPSVAVSIAEALSSDYKKVAQGGCPLLTFNGLFQNEKAEIRVTSTAGHLYEIEFASPEACSDPSQLFDAEVKWVPVKKNFVYNLQNEAKNHPFDYLVLWLDCDREGENICFEVIDVLKPYLKQAKTGTKNFNVERVPGVPENVFRIHFSSLVKKDIQNAFKSLHRPDKNKSDSVAVRQEIDLKLGISVSRLLTAYLRDSYGSLISYGPCQMPTLWFVVQRAELIQQFVPQPFSLLQIDVSPDDSSKPIKLQSSVGKIFDDFTAKALKEYVSQFDSVIVIKYDKSFQKVSRPLPFNTVEMLKSASSFLDVSPHRAMQLAEDLYLSGLITYPRTESTKYAKNFDIRSIVSSLKLAGYPDAAALENTFEISNRGIDCGDHPPITPCSTVPDSNSFRSSEHSRLYNLIVEQFLASISRDATKLILKLEVALNDESSNISFSVVFSTLHDPGFFSIQRCLENTDPALKTGIFDAKEIAVGKILKIDRVYLHSDTTKVPDYLTEANLLSLMAKNGIGTDASMAQHIHNVIQRGYVELIEKRRLRPTKLGSALCKGLCQIDYELAQPTVRALIESQCLKVAESKMDGRKVLKHVLKEFSIKFQYLLRNIQILNDVLDVSIQAVAERGQPLSRCGSCKRYLRYHNNKLLCSICSFSLTIPKSMKIFALGEKRCPLDSFELLVLNEKSGKAYCICPLCFNFSPDQTINRFRCIDTDRPDLFGSLHTTGVGTCEEDGCSGKIYIQNFQGAQRGLSCTECNWMVQLDPTKFKNIKKKQPTVSCTDCGWDHIEVYEIQSSEVITGCPRCNDDILTRIGPKFRSKKKYPSKRRRHPTRY